MSSQDVMHTEELPINGMINVKPKSTTEEESLPVNKWRVPQWQAVVGPSPPTHVCSVCVCKSVHVEVCSVPK